MIRFYNGRLLSFKNGFEITDDEVWTNGSEIAFVGKNHDKKADREVDLNGNLLMPAFKNAHTHSAMTFARSLADDLPLQPWLYDMIFPMEAKLNESDIYTLSRLAFLEYLSSGISACFDMYYYPEAMAKASVDAGFRTVMCGAVNNFKESVSLLDEYYQKYNSYDELISYRLGFHAEYTTSKELMNGIALLAEKHEAPVFTHSSETKSEVEGCLERYGKTPTELFEELGLFNYGGGGFHSVWMSENDLEIYKKHGIWAVINAGSNSKLASGIAPLEKMQKAGINTAIGTDGPSSNNALDMFREMYLVTALQKIKTGNPQALPPTDVLKMACSALPKALHIDNDCLSIGKLADIIVIDLHQPNMQPINNIADNIVYSGSKSNVALTMVDGKILYENGKFYIDKDAELVYEKCNEAVKGLI